MRSVKRRLSLAASGSNRARRQLAHLATVYLSAICLLAGTNRYASAQEGILGDISSAITAVESALGGPAQADTSGRSDRTRPWGGPPGDRRDRPWPGPRSAPRQPAPDPGGVQLPPAAPQDSDSQGRSRSALPPIPLPVSPARERVAPAPSPALLLAPAPAPRVLDVALTALAAEWRVSGPGVWPWDSTKSEALLAALADTLPALAGKTLVTAVRGAGTPVALRLLLQAQAAKVSAAEVTTQLSTGSAHDVQGIRAQAQRIAVNGELQAALQRHGLAASSVELLAATPVLPVGGSAPTPALPLSTIFGIVAALALVLGALACALYLSLAARCVSRKGQALEESGNMSSPAAVPPFFASYPAFVHTSSGRQCNLHAAQGERNDPG